MTEKPLQFEFATAARILFGLGRFAEVGKLAAELGRKAFIASGMNAEQQAALAARLKSAGVLATFSQVTGEPTIPSVMAGLEQARGFSPDLVIGFGGGSAIDTGKAIAILLTNHGDPLDYLEVVGRGQPLRQPPLPMMAIPTTAGTGSEVTRNAVLGVPGQKVKVSQRSPLMLPRIALVDPELTYDLPPEITASTGFDALIQLIEPFVCNQPSPLVDALCREGIPRAARSLAKAVEDGHNAPARTDMALVSLFGGLALANARLGAVHGLASVLGGMYDAPHGAVCARLLWPVMAANIESLRLKESGDKTLERYREIASLLTGRRRATPEIGLAWVNRLIRRLKIPRLWMYGVQPNDFPEIIEKAQRASSMRGNPVVLGERELAGILEMAL